MSHNTVNAIGFVAFIGLIGFLCFLWNTGWPLLLLLCAGGFATDKELEYRKWKKENGYDE